MELIHHAVLRQHVYLPGNGNGRNIHQEQYVSSLELTLGEAVSCKAGCHYLYKGDDHSQLYTVEDKGK